MSGVSPPSNGSIGSSARSVALESSWRRRQGWCSSVAIPASGKASIRQQIAARLQVPQVFLAGWHTHEELPEFFSAADAVVLTSAREQFGQVLVEGMACGLPAVATRSLGPAAIINDGQTGWLVEPDSQDALVTALTEVVQDRAERERRGELARIVARERYSWAGASEQLATLLTDILSSAGGHPPDTPIRDRRSRRSPRVDRS